MKIEQLLVQYFYSAKQVTLQGIGSFTLSPNFIFPLDTDKDIVLPQDSISFQPNLKAVQDEGLVNYIVQQTRKIKPLASADLESYLMLATQFLNIGKPFKIEGVGTLEKKQDGEYQFLQGQFINTKVENATAQLTEKAREDVSFGNKKETTTYNPKLIALITAALVLVVILTFSIYFLSKRNNAPITLDNKKERLITTLPSTIAPNKDSATIQLQKPDSIAKPIASNTLGYTFKVVIRNYSSLIAAQNAYKRFTSFGHKLLLYTTDSVTYKLAIPFTTSMADTTRAKDSLQKRLFGGSPYIDLH